VRGTVVTRDHAVRGVRQAAFINAAALARFRGWGGVRIEDVVRVTASGIDNFTWAPRTVADVEAVCAGAKTSRFELERKTGV
jgi:Xaa-Pro dipeptidase